MGHTKDQLLSRLQELQIKFSKYEHPVVLTVEEQAKHVGPEKGALSKNLFLKDKKQKFYIVSALADTKVDLKVLSQRLGLGKGGVRMAPEEALGEILQVPLGCVTPFALVNESARHVSLLLDQGFKTQDSCVFHPLSNDTSIALNARDLDKFLNSIEKAPVYVDLEANPKVGKDQPPDLAAYVPSETVVLADTSQPEASPQESEKIQVAANSKPSKVDKGKEVKAKPSNASTKGKSPGPPIQSSTFADPDKCVGEILEILSKKVNEEDMEKYRIILAQELKSTLTMFKNTAYTEGFKSGTQCKPYKL